MMKDTFLANVIVVLFATDVFGYSLAQSFKAINFPSARVTQVGDPCQHYSGVKGACQEMHNCPDIRSSLIRREISFPSVSCKGTDYELILVCCLSGRASQETTDISEPASAKGCGETWNDRGVILDEIYQGNNTAEFYINEGFTIKILEMRFDHIYTFEYSKGQETRKWNRLSHGKHFAVGGFNARRVLTVYMALLGTADEWLCDGVLISNIWVLTAAHCFDDRSMTVVRLGEYDISNDTTLARERPLDFDIERTVVHPDYRFPSAYHDLALVKLAKPIPQLRPDMKPICLPWGEESSVNIVGKTVTLTGWGATIFLGPSTPILQEVNITVFNPSLCDKSYSKLSDYRDKFPKGITKETSVCAGDEEGGKDACQGDSGGPIVYLNNKERFTLAGIVSTGNGCGLKEFPGIYVPLHNPLYLSWIRGVVFKDQ